MRNGSNPVLAMINCHCGSHQTFEDCCEPVISGQKIAQTAEQLMRSRYSAFVEQNQQWLLDSWHPQTRPSRVSFDSNQRWIGLSIKNTLDGQAHQSTGQVEFVARFKINGKAVRLRENSYFERVNGLWLYRRGDHLD